MNPNSSDELVAPMDVDQTGGRKNLGRNYWKESTVTHAANKLTNVQHCILCGTETQLHNNGQPMCPKCCDSLEASPDVW